GGLRPRRPGAVRGGGRRRRAGRLAPRRDRPAHGRGAARRPRGKAARLERTAAARAGTRRDLLRRRRAVCARRLPAPARRPGRRTGRGAGLGSLGPADAARLALYLAMRSVAHAVAWWRYRRRATAGIWRQAVTTKRWDAA